MNRRIQSIVVFQFAACCAMPRAAEEPPAIVMSPFEVSANSVEFEQWVKVRTPQLLIYSDAPVNDVLATARELEQLRIAGERYLGRDSRTAAPRIIVLPTSRSDWRSIEHAGGPEWRVAISSPAGQLVDLILVQYNWQLRGRSVLRAATGSAHLRSLNLLGPPWFDRGMGFFLETARFGADTVEFGRMSVRARALWLRGWMPWPRFFELRYSSPEFLQSDGVRRYTGQCAAFVHYLLTHPDPIWRERLMRWRSLLRAGREPTEEAFRSVFGQNWTEWQATMERHRKDRRENVTTIRLTAAERDFRVEQVNLPVQEMRELFLLAQILNQRIPASEQALDNLLARSLKTEGLRELLVEACAKWKRDDGRQAHLRALVEAGSANPAVHAMYAWNVFRRDVPRTTIHSRLGEEAAMIRASCTRALALEPSHERALNLLAWTHALGPSVNREDILAIEQAYRTILGTAPTGEILSALTIAHGRAGNLGTARGIGELLVESPLAGRDAKEVAAALLTEIGTEK